MDTAKQLSTMQNVPQAVLKRSLCNLLKHGSNNPNLRDAHNQLLWQNSLQQPQCQHTHHNGQDHIAGAPCEQRRQPACQ